MKSCIIAGEGNLPILLAEKNKDFLVIAIRSLAALSSFENEAYTVDMHEFNEMIKNKASQIKKAISVPTKTENQVKEKKDWTKNQA